MRSRTLALAALAIVATGTSAAAQAASQPATAPAPAPAAAATAPAAQPNENWPASPVGKYSLSIDRPDGKLNGTLTVTDSAGKLSAGFFDPSDGETHPMSAQVNGQDLVLTAITPGGALVFTLHKAGKQVNGGWTFRGEQGNIAGTIDG